MLDVETGESKTDRYSHLVEFERCLEKGSSTFSGNMQTTCKKCADRDVLVTYTSVLMGFNGFFVYLLIG